MGIYVIGLLNICEQLSYSNLSWPQIRTNKNAKIDLLGLTTALKKRRCKICLGLVIILEKFQAF